MKRLVHLAAGFVGDDRGMETVEWAVLASLLVVGLITTVKLLGNQISNKFTNLQTATS